MDQLKISIYLWSALEDRDSEQALHRHLASLGKQPSVWVDGTTLVQPGKNLLESQHLAIARSDIIVALLTSHFFALAGIDQALQDVLVRAEKEKIRVLFVLVKDCDVAATQVKDCKLVLDQPVSGYANPDIAWAEIAVVIRRTVEALRGDRTSLPPPLHRLRTRRKGHGWIAWVLLAILLSGLSLGALYTHYSRSVPRPNRPSETPAASIPPSTMTHPRPTTPTPTQKPFSVPMVKSPLPSCTKANDALKRGAYRDAQELARQEHLKRPTPTCSLVLLEATIRDDYTSPQIDRIMREAAGRVRTISEKTRLAELQRLQNQYSAQGKPQ